MIVKERLDIILGDHSWEDIETEKNPNQGTALRTWMKFNNSIQTLISHHLNS